MSEPVDLVASPRWRQAVRDFLAAGFNAGDIVSMAWLEEHFGMEPLADDALLSGAAYRERQFKWLQSVEAFKRELLEDHQIYLASVFGEGYRVTPPAEQTALAADKFEGDMKRAFKNAALRLTNVRHLELTDEQRRENLDAVSKLSMLRGMTKQALE